jgi:UDP-N-acetylmuramate dehydrogenase
MSSTQTAPYSSADLSNLTTFGVPAKAAHYAEVESVAELQEALAWGKEQDLPILALGGGSNMLFSEDFEGLVIHHGIKGKEVVQETDELVQIRFGSGENWHEVVVWCVEHGYQGIENLALIPGTIGAAPIQNIGAYGVELVDVFIELEAVDRQTGSRKTFSKEECEFGYRDSKFKQPGEKGRWLITSVTLQLQKNSSPNTEYRALSTGLNAKGISDPTPKQVMETVIEIRRSKLPDPAEIGNAGSFFKNPIVDRPVAERIREDHPEMPSYPMSRDQVKIPAGWLIEQMGWKGKNRDGVGCFEHQALVLVNLGGATGSKVIRFARDIRDSVEQAFGIRLQAEVNIINKEGYTTL